MIDTRKIIVAIMFVAICGVLGWFGRDSTEAPVTKPVVKPETKPDETKPKLMM